MKKITICLLLTAMAHFCFSQQTSTTASKVETDYMKKSKNQKKVAWIMLGGGATFVLTGILIPHGEIVREDFWNTYENDGIKSTFVVTGFLSMIGSIPFFIASGKNKKRAASISFINERAPQLVKSNFAYRPVPSLTFKIIL